MTSAEIIDNINKNNWKNSLPIVVDIKSIRLRHKEILLPAIYKITSPSNKIYIGKARKIFCRLGGYRISQCKSQPRIYNSFLKYGIDNHSFEIIDICEEGRLNELEQQYINFYDTFGTPHGLNLTSGGDGGKLSEESIEKLRKFKTGKPNLKIRGIPKSPEHRRRISEMNKGKKLSEETKKNISNSRIGKYCGENNPMYGKTHTEETRKILSEKHTGKILSEETRRNMSESGKGRVFTNEHCNNISQTVSGSNNHFYGKSHTEATIQKMIDAHKNKKRSKNYNKYKKYRDRIKQERLTMIF